VDDLKSVRRSALVFRWIARIWSIPIFIFALVRTFTPDPYATEPVPTEDWFLLSLWGVAILGLLVAWRWEMVGGIMTIATMFFRELVWVLLKGNWIVNFLIIWAAVVPPAILFLVAWALEKKAESAERHPGTG
jgi:hypothetical protein